MNKSQIDDLVNNNPRATSPNARRTIIERACRPHELSSFSEIDWKKALSRFNPDFEYPQYYLKGYHGVGLTESGYLSPAGAMTWDPVVRETFSYLEIPGFSQAEVTKMVVEDAARHLPKPPRRILDMGTGTGHAALAFASFFPQAEVWGVDLAAPMLVIAEHKARIQGLQNRVRFSQASADHTRLESGKFDLVLAWILFHELPALFARQVLAEMHRVCAPGGSVIIYDAFDRQSLRYIPFPEPYLREFQQLDFADELAQAGFVDVLKPELGGGHWYALARKKE